MGRDTGEYVGRTETERGGPDGSDGVDGGTEDAVDRDAEERAIAYSVLVVAGVTAVGWFAWIATTARSPAIASLVIVGSMATTLVSVPASVAGVFLVERSDRDWPRVARSTAIAMVSAVVAATVYVVLWGMDGQIVLFGSVLALLAAWVVVPLTIGAIGTASGRGSMIGVLLAWPPSNLLALTLFVAPAPGGIDFGRYNAFFLDEPFRSLLVLLIVAVVSFGPAALGRLVDRVITVRVRDR